MSRDDVMEEIEGLDDSEKKILEGIVQRQQDELGEQA